MQGVRINKSRFKNREKVLEKVVNYVFSWRDKLKTAIKVTFSRNVSDKGKQLK